MCFATPASALPLNVPSMPAIGGPLWWHDNSTPARFATSLLALEADHVPRSDAMLAEKALVSFNRPDEVARRVVHVAALGGHLLHVLDDHVRLDEGDGQR